MNDQFAKPAKLEFIGNVAENFRRFKQQFEIYMSAAGYDSKEVPKRKQAAILLNLDGEEAIEVYNTFTFDDETEQDPEVILQKFQEYCEPKKNITFERHVFNTRTQQPTQSFDCFVTELRVQAKKCAYGALQEELIRDRIVVGIRDDNIRSRLLREPDLSLQKCIDIVRAAEVAKKQMHNIKEETNVVHKLSSTNMNEEQRNNERAKNRGQQGNPREQNTKRTQKPDCRYWGSQHVFRKELCPAFGKTCSACGKGNHFAKVCQSSRCVNFTNIRTISDSSDDELFIGTVTAQEENQQEREQVQKESEWTSKLKINGQTIHIKLDTGAKCNVMSKTLFNKIRANDVLQKSRTRIIAYGGHKIDVIGHTTLLCEYKKRFYALRFYVIDNEDSPLLGIEACQELNLVQRVGELKSRTPESIKEEYSDVFENSSLGCLPVKHTIRLKEDAKPVIHAPRKIPVALRTEVKQELDRMKKLGVIESIEEPTEWVSSMVAITKPNKTRICLDPRDLNASIKREHYPMPTIEEVASRLPNAAVFSTLDATSGYRQIRVDEESSKLLAFNSPFGRFCFKRLPFGISSASEVFQRTMNDLFGDINGCEIIVDDTLVWGQDEEEHDQRLLEVLERARKVGLRHKMEKVQVQSYRAEVYWTCINIRRLET